MKLINYQTDFYEKSSLSPFNIADMSGYATQLLSEAAIDSHDTATLNAIKSDLGTGKDEATQAANQVLLGSDNETLLNALDDHQLEFQNKTMVYIWKGVGDGESAFGHVSASVNDTSYSFGPDGMDIKPLEKYINKQTEFRNELAVEIPLSPAEEKKFESFLKSYDRPYWINYCPSPVNQGLHELGYKFDSQIIPMSLYMELMRNNIGKNPTVIEKTK